MSRKKPTRRHRFPIILSIIILFISLFILISNLVTIRTTKDHIFIQLGASPIPRDCILVLGAGLESDGTPCRVLRDRLDTAADVYRSGVAPVLVVSGDKHEGHDEPEAMMEYLRDEQGIPETDIIMDPEGFSTWDSVRNVKAMGYQRIVAVTQRYHLYRTIRAASRMGMECVGVDAVKDGRNGTGWMLCREVLARAAYEMRLIFCCGVKD